MKVNVASDLPTPRRSVDLPHYLTRQEMEALLRAPEGNQPLVLRDLAAMELLYACGIRASELTGLRQADFHQSADGRWALKVLGKGNKERLAFIASPGVRQTLADYLATERPTLVGPGQAPWLFVTRSGNQLSRVTLWKLVKKYAARSGISGNVSPHTLRHCFATHMLAGGAGIRELQELLGHASVATTQLYTQVEHSRLKGLHEQCHPRG